MRINRILLLAASLILAVASGARAQGIHLTANGGMYRQASNFVTLKNDAQEVDLNAGNAFALGANLELGPLRATAAYVSGATLSREGLDGKVGEGKLLAVAADLVIRPIPRIVIAQPYLLGGVGLKRNDYNFKDANLKDDFKDYRSKSDLSLHWGVGADFMFGGIGIMAEFNDFITFVDRKFGAHDAFGVIGLRLKLF